MPKQQDESLDSCFFLQSYSEFAKVSVEERLYARGIEELSKELQDEEMLSSIFDCATDSLARTAAMAQEAVEHRRTLLREMAVRERQIDQKLARTARNLERLIAG